jgi:hypothetical protein
MTEIRGERNDIWQVNGDSLSRSERWVHRIGLRAKLPALS